MKNAANSVEPLNDETKETANGHMQSNLIQGANGLQKSMMAGGIGPVVSETMSDCLAPIKDPLWFKGANAFATRKTVLAGLLVVTLLVSTAGQLKTLMRVSTVYPFYNAVLGLLITCIIVEIVVGGMLFWLGRFNINREEQRHRADIVQNVAMALIVVLFILNVMITAFGIEELWYVVPVSSYPPGFVPQTPGRTTNPTLSTRIDYNRTVL